ncbi:MAG: aldo/keto reductase [Pirellula sp.]|nr:aldo/keto reductase [Pirellula sp.]
MQYRPLGSTSEHTSVLGLGGWHLGLKTVDEQLSLRIMHTAVEQGVNFFDNSWDYNEGVSELRMGKALKEGLRNKVLLMTKIDGRNKKEAAKQLDESLRRLKAETIDIVQHHEIIRYEDPWRIFHEDGANAALIEAKQAGKIRFIGFTGHKDPHIHLQMLDYAAEQGFRFDTVQMPLNVMDAHFRSFEQLVVPRLVKEKVAVLGMKSIANGIILRSKTVTAVECLKYALSLPTSVVISGIDSLDVLMQNLDAVKGFQPYTADERIALLNRTAEAAQQGKFEPFKTSSIFDSTAKEPKWLGEEPKSIRDLMPM